MTKSSSPPARGRLRRVLRWLGGAFGVVVLLALAGVGALLSSSGKAWVRHRLEASLRHELNGDLSIGELEYSLFGELALGDVVVKDEDGEQAVTLHEVKLLPAWRSLLGDAPTLEELSVSGVHVHVRELEDGTTNLDHLAREKPSTSEAPSEAPPKKKLAEVRLVAFKIEDVKVDVEKLDGSRGYAALTSAVGSIDAHPASGGLDLEIPKIQFKAEFTPSGGARFALIPLDTAITAHLVDGAGDVVLGPTRFGLETTPVGGKTRGSYFNLDPIHAHVTKTDLKVVAAKVLLDVVEAKAIEIERSTGKPHTMRALLEGVRVSAERLNGYAGKEVLGTDLHLDADVEGPRDKLVLIGALKGGGATIDWRGDLDASSPDEPKFELHLEAKRLDTSELLGKDLHAPNVRVDAITLDVDGSGETPEDAEANAKLEILGVTAPHARVDAVRAKAHLEKGELRVTDIEIDSLGQTVRGEATFGLADKKLHLVLSPSGRGRDLAAAMKDLGLVTPPALASLAIAPESGSIRVDGHAGGEVRAIVSMKHVGIGGGTADVDADVSLAPNAPGVEPAMRVEAMRATVALAGIDVASLAPRPLPVRATLSGHVEVAGPPDAVVAHAELAMRVHGKQEGAKTARLDVRADIDEGRAKVHLAARDAEGTGAPIATVEASAPLAGKALALDGPLDVRVDVPRRALADLEAYAPGDAIEKLPKGEVELHARIGGSARRPDGKFDLDLVVAALGGETQRVHVAGLVHPSKSAGLAIEADADAWLRQGQDAASAHAHVTLDGQRFDGHSPFTWSIGLDVPKTDLASLPLPPERLAGLSGTIAASAKLHGTNDDVAGDVGVSLEDVRRNDRGPLAVKLALGLSNDKTHLDVGVRAKETPVLAVQGDVGLGGRGLLAAARAHKLDFDPTLDVALEVPDAALADLAPLAPPLARFPGHVHGKGNVHGRVKSPALALGLALDHYKTIDGHDGHVGVDLAADTSRASLELGLGNVGDERAIAIDAALPITGGSGPFGIPEAKATARADAVDLRSIVPAVLLGNKHVEVAGRLAWDMKGAFSVKPTLHGIALKANIDGDLALTKGKLDLVGTRPCAGPATRLCSDRKIDGIELKLESDASELKIARLTAHEADVEKSDRRLDVSGTIGWSDLWPERADLKIEAKDWLVFGGEKLGAADAPRAALSAKIKLGGELDGPVKVITANVEALDFRAPDRFDRSHQPEVVSLGDVLEIGAPGVEKGKLPLLPPSESEATKPSTAPPTRPAKNGEPIAEKELEVEDKGLDLHVRIPKRVHLEQAPLDLYVEGNLDVTTRGAERRVRGKIVAVDGSLGLGGKRHALDHGSIVFDEAHPQGFIDLHFARVLPAETLRDISQASGGDAVRIDMTGAIGKQKPALSGAGNATLFDVLAVDNGGRERFVSAPDLPTSETVQFPRHEDLLVLSFLSVNLPHLLFLDRISAWADPYEDTSSSSYGRIHDVDGEKTSESGHTRIRAVERPPQHPGESQNELELDALFWNTRRSAAGVGVTGGDRGGGGPTIFWEWVSGN